LGGEKFLAANGLIHWIAMFYATTNKKTNKQTLTSFHNVNVNQMFLTLYSGSYDTQGTQMA